MSSLRVAVSSMQERAMRERLRAAAAYSSSRGRVGGRGVWRRGFCDGRESAAAIGGRDEHQRTASEENYAHRFERRIVDRGSGIGAAAAAAGTPNHRFQAPLPQPQPSGFRRQAPPYNPRSAPPWRALRPDSGIRSHCNGVLPRQSWQRPPPADFRKWLLSSSPSPPDTGRFSVLSYNILADYLARDHRSKLYFHVPPEILDWEWRKHRLLIEFGLWSPDIMCLQEVDRFPDLEEELNRRGYSGVWKMRTGDAVDGCAIFWRESRFVLRHVEHIEFAKLGLRDNVAQICVFESTRSQRSKFAEASTDGLDPPGIDRIVVCNIHVLFNPKRGDIKLGQVRTLLNQAHTVSKAWNDAPVIICGDFNSIPMSPLYNFISEQKLNLSGLARSQVSGQYSHIFYPPRTFTQEAVLKSNTNNSNNEENAFSEIKINTSVVDMPQQSKITTTEEREEAASQELTVIQISEERSMSHLCIVSEDGDMAVTVNSSSSSWISESVTFISDVEIKDLEVQPCNSGEDENLALSSSQSFELENCDNSDAEDGEPNHSFLEELHGPADLREPVEELKSFSYSDPYAWTPMEIAAPTGDAERTIIEHSLKLTSAYTEVEDFAGTKGTNREPMVTSYHRQFMGTVDYIWRSEGLQTIRVLDTIPPNVLRRTAGFPTRKWGSDHIALVCEFAFKKS
ncbi:DNAse I-like superfamily protein [Wolffia australiana]